MSDASKPSGSSILAQALQPLFWFLLMASTLACASNLALELAS